jgi:catechol 2,3-dioxygenase-like lactoylglutathione lyase family enzyme
MTEGASIGHTAIKVRDIVGMIKMIENLLGFHVVKKKGEGEVPTSVWFEEGLQLVSDPDFDGPEGRLHHIGVLVSDKNTMVQVCQKRGLSEVRPNWYALPDGLVLEFLDK